MSFGVAAVAVAAEVRMAAPAPPAVSPIAAVTTAATVVTEPSDWRIVTDPHPEEARPGFLAWRFLKLINTFSFEVWQLSLHVLPTSR
jgi:hypothetical protein